jgi:hypothetical protein
MHQSHPAMASGIKLWMCLSRLSDLCGRNAAKRVETSPLSMASIRSNESAEAHLVDATKKRLYHEIGIERHATWSVYFSQ